MRDRFPMHPSDPTEMPRAEATSRKRNRRPFELSGLTVAAPARGRPSSLPSLAIVNPQPAARAGLCLWIGSMVHGPTK